MILSDDEVVGTVKAKHDNGSVSFRVKKKDAQSLGILDWIAAQQGRQLYLELRGKRGIKGILFAEIRLKPLRVEE